jgi:hypothetical protein
MSIPDLCIYFVIGLVSVAYPILLQVIATLDEKYASIVIVDLFKKELEYLFFRIFLVTALCLIGLYAVINLSVTLSGVSWLIRLIGYGLLLVTALLILTFLLFISKILIYYTPARIVKYFIEKKEDRGFEYFNALSDILYFAIDKNLDGIAILIHDYYYKTFAKIRQQQKGKPVEYPDPYYQLVNNIVSRLAPNPNPKFSFLEHRAVGGIWLIGELLEVTISEQTYGCLWRALTIAVTFKRDDMVMHWWANAHQIFRFYMDRIQTDASFEEGVETVKNQAQIDKRNLERERFLEFNYALGGLLLYKNRLDCIRRIFSYTSSSPPDYVLLPIHMNQVFKTFFQFWDPYHDVFPFIRQRYWYPETEGIKSEDLVKIWTCKYVAVLLLRQYSLVPYYVYVKPLELPLVPAKKLERRMWIDNLSYFETYVSEQFENVELLNQLGWTKLDRSWLVKNKKTPPGELVVQVKSTVIAADERIEKEQELDPDEVQVLKETISNIISDAFDKYDDLFDTPIKSNFHDYAIKAVRTIMDKSEFVKDKISGSNEHSITASGIADDLAELVANTFSISSRTQINVREEQIFAAVDRLGPDPENYVIVNFGFNISFISSYYKVAGLTDADYHDLKLYNFPAGRSGRRLYIVRKDQLPYLFTNEPAGKEIKQQQLELIGPNHLYFSIIDLYRNKVIRDEWLASELVSDQQKADMEKMVQLYIAFLTVIRWKKDTHLIAISVVYPHTCDESGLTLLGTIKKIDG